MSHWRLGLAEADQKCFEWQERLPAKFADRSSETVKRQKCRVKARTHPPMSTLVLVAILHEL
jgi:hypothetical protein